MRAILIVGMMAVAGPALADDFGVSVEKFSAAMLNHKALQFRDLGCKPEFCFIGSPSDKHKISYSRSKAGIVDMVMLDAPAAAWAENAEILDAIQESLSIRPAGRIDARDATRTSGILPGAGLAFKGRHITCSVMKLLKQEDRFIAACKPT